MKLLPLSGQHKDKYVIVDDDDYERLIRYAWYFTTPAKNKYYATATISEKTLFMHRFILRLIDPEVWVDHIDGNGLNNQKHNLRLCNKIQNAFNMIKPLVRAGKHVSSIHKGVSYNKKSFKWKVSITAKNIIHNANSKESNRIFIGYYDTELDAAIAYNHAAKEYHGEFAKLNDIENWETIIPTTAKTNYSSEYFGVWYNKTTNRWVATIKNEVKIKHNRHFNTELDAAIYYNKKATEFFGDKAKLNIITIK